MCWKIAGSKILFNIKANNDAFHFSYMHCNFAATWNMLKYRVELPDILFVYSCKKEQFEFSCTKRLSFSLVLSQLPLFWNNSECTHNMQSECMMRIYARQTWQHVIYTHSLCVFRSRIKWHKISVYIVKIKFDVVHAEEIHLEQFFALLSFYLIMLCVLTKMLAFSGREPLYEFL